VLSGRGIQIAARGMKTSPFLPVKLVFSKSARLFSRVEKKSQACLSEEVAETGENPVGA
jgi:hypothetical protein